MSSEDIMNWYGCDTVVQCKKCGRRQFLNFVDGLKNGWSECCGETMPIMQCKADIGKAVQSIIPMGIKEIKKRL